jgi:hypothetical protein
MVGVWMSLVPLGVLGKGTLYPLICSSYVWSTLALESLKLVRIKIGNLLKLLEVALPSLISFLLMISYCLLMVLRLVVGLSLLSLMIYVLALGRKLISPNPRSFSLPMLNRMLFLGFVGFWGFPALRILVDTLASPCGPMVGVLRTSTSLLKKSKRSLQVGSLNSSPLRVELS